MATDVPSMLVPSPDEHSGLRKLRPYRVGRGGMLPFSMCVVLSVGLWTGVEMHEWTPVGSFGLEFGNPPAMQRSLLACAKRKFTVEPGGADARPAAERRRRRQAEASQISVNQGTRRR